jgi:hypothetical protein
MQRVGSHVDLPLCYLPACNGLEAMLIYRWGSRYDGGASVLGTLQVRLHFHHKSRVAASFNQLLPLIPPSVHLMTSLNWLLPLITPSVHLMTSLNWLLT